MKRGWVEGGPQGGGVPKGGGAGMKRGWVMGGGLGRGRCIGGIFKERGEGECGSQEQERSVERVCVCVPGFVGCVCVCYTLIF